MFAGLWLNEQRRRRRAEGETNVLLVELAEAVVREGFFRRDRVELIETIRRLESSTTGRSVVVFPPNYIGESDNIDIRA